MVGAELHLRDGEDHRDRLDLRDHDEAVCVHRSYIVARVDLPEARSSVRRSDDMAIRNIEPLRVHLRLIGFQDPFQLADRRRRGVEILA
jgi:hypothetical protein